MKRRKRLLLADPDESLRVVVAHYLSMHGYTIQEAGSGAELLALVGASEFDAILLDLNLPDEDGLALLRRLRMFSKVPVVVISARDDETSRIVALELRADDYLTKPFNPRELLLRLRRILRDANVEGEPRCYVAGPLHIDLRQRLVHTLSGEPVTLTTAEFNLLVLLASEAGGVVSRTMLADAAATTVDGGSPESVTVLIHRLRRKLAEATGFSHDSLVQTVPRFGYRLAVAVRRYQP